MPKTLDKFQEIRYNNKDEYRALQEFKQYRAKNPETTITREEYKVVLRIKEIGLKGEPILNPKKIDTTDYSFSDDHINKTDHHRNITKEQAEGYIESAIFSLKQWKGQRFVFYSNNGATVIDTGKKKIVSSFNEVDFDDKVRKAIQEVIKWKK